MTSCCNFVIIAEISLLSIFFTITIFSAKLFLLNLLGNVSSAIEIDNFDAMFYICYVYICSIGRIDCSLCLDYWLKLNGLVWVKVKPFLQVGGEGISGNLLTVFCKLCAFNQWLSV